MCDWTSIFLILVRFSFAVQFFFVVVAFSLEFVVFICAVYRKEQSEIESDSHNQSHCFSPSICCLLSLFRVRYVCVYFFLALYCCVSVNWCYSCYRLTLYHTTPHTLYHRLRVNTLYHSVSARFSVWLFFTPYTVYDNIFFWLTHFRSHNISNIQCDFYFALFSDFLFSPKSSTILFLYALCLVQ